MPSHKDVRRVIRERQEAIEEPAPTPADRAISLGQDVRQAADRFLSAVRAFLPHANKLSKVDKQAVAYTIIHTCNAVMTELEDGGQVANSVVVGVIGEGARRAS